MPTMGSAKRERSVSTATPVAVLQATTIAFACWLIRNPSDGGRSLLDECVRSLTVRGVCGIRDIQQILAGELLPDLSKHGQAADTGIEHADRFANSHRMQSTDCRYWRIGRVQGRVTRPCPDVVPQAVLFCNPAILQSARIHRAVNRVLSQCVLTIVPRTPDQSGRRSLSRQHALSSRGARRLPRGMFTAQRAL